MFCDRCEIFWKEVISKVHLSGTINTCEDVRWVAHETMLHHSIRDLRSSSDISCRLCRIILSTPTEYEYTTILKDDDEKIDVVLKMDPSKGPHPVLSVEFRGGLGNSIKIPKRIVASCSGLLNDDKLASTIDSCIKLSNDHTGSDGSLELADFWLKQCVASHEKCGTFKKHSFIPTRLLDISNDVIRLIESRYQITQGADRNFVALSHCWGLIPIIRTLITNYEEHCKQITPEQLSKTFRDAVHTTRKLGYRYLWIDSLCIIQDDTEDWAREAETMCDVYRYAALTIAAAHAPGGDVGCFAKRDGLLQLPFYINFPEPTHEAPTRIQFTSYGRVADVGGGDPALYGRAWVLQEQLLSPRMLIFDGLQLRWECLSMHGSEGSPVAGLSRHGLHHKYIRKGIMEDLEYFDQPDTAEDRGQDRSFWARIKHQYWCSLIMEYTHRGMTKSKDRLVAIAGIAKALGRHTRNQYLAGLWSEYFTTGLLWSVAHNEKWVLSSVKGFDLENSLKARHIEIIAPSWSWASVTVPVMYAQTELLSYDSICHVVNVDVSGRIDKQAGKARIRGHVRRGFVNPIYPFAIREAADKFPHMMAPLPSGRKGLEYAKFKGRCFHPNDYFLFTESNPAADSGKSTAQEFSMNGNFRLVRGSFRPDELMDPSTEITFVAIAQQHFGSQLTSLLNKYDNNAALKVHTLALVPTSTQPNEFRRIGLAIWDQCAWYGYLCGWKDERDRRVYRSGNFSKDGYLQDDTCWDWLARKLWWDDFEFYDQCELGKHRHPYRKEEIPDMAKYHPYVEVEEKTVVIV